MIDSAVFNFFNHCPILPISILITNTAGFIPLVFVLYIAQIAPLHSNCRYILCIWALGFGASFLVNLVIAELDLENESGYMPMTLLEPHHFNLYRWYTRCGTFSASCEILLSTERILSVIYPTKYHLSAFAWKTLLLLTLSIMAFSHGVDYFVHNAEQSLRLFGTVILGVIEVAVLATGIIAKRICCYQYLKMCKNPTLIKRYQTKEAYEMSRAMIPAYALSFTLKQSSILVLYAYFALDDMSLTGYAQDYLILATVANGMFSMINLLCKHAQLRVHSTRKLRRLLGMKSMERRRSNSVAEDTDAYFSMYSLSWR